MASDVVNFVWVEASKHPIALSRVSCKPTQGSQNSIQIDVCITWRGCSANSVVRSTKMATSSRAFRRICCWNSDFRRIL